MSPALRSWLLSSPVLKGVSPLVLDAGASGWMDIEDEIAKAVSVCAREAAGGRSLSTQPIGYHERVARMFSWRSMLRKTRLEKGIAVLQGSMGPGAGISQTGRHAVLYVRTVLPETVVAAMPGRRLGQVVELPLPCAMRSIITSAKHDRTGLTIWFEVGAVRPWPLKR